MSDKRAKLLAAFIAFAGILMSLSLAFGATALHKHYMEQIVGHSVTWWQAIWTK